MIQSKEELLEVGKEIISNFSLFKEKLVGICIIFQTPTGFYTNLNGMINTGIIEALEEAIEKGAEEYDFDPQ